MKQGQGFRDVSGVRGIRVSLQARGLQGGQGFHGGGEVPKHLGKPGPRRHRSLEEWLDHFSAGVATMLMYGSSLVILLLLGLMFAPGKASTARHSQLLLASAQDQVKTISRALSSFRKDVGRFPTAKEGFSALVTCPPALENWHGPYLQRLPTDPWGGSFHYQSPGIHNKRGTDIWSDGPDSQSAEDDITNWEAKD